jgi:HK97 family phage prohead protease
MAEFFTPMVRGELAGDGNTLFGYAAVYGEVAETTNEGFAETIARGAFDEVLADPATDARAVFNHSMSHILGRQSAGTLKLRSDDVGLRYDITLPRTTFAEDLKEMVRRGDITGASFAFAPGEMQRGKSPGGRVMVTHTKIKRLVDISVVPLPVYAGASVALRGQDPNAAAIARRAQMIRARARVKGLVA